jgi:hypothetical protein
MPSSADVLVLIDPNPIPVVRITPGESLKLKSSKLYVSTNDKIVLYGSCAPATDSGYTLEWTIRDSAGGQVDISDTTWLALGSTNKDFVLLGDSGLLSPGESVRVPFHLFEFFQLCFTHML